MTPDPTRAGGPPASGLRQRIVLLAGLACCALGLLLSRPGLRLLFGPEGVLADRPLRRLSTAAAIVLIVLGALLVAFRRREAGVNLLLLTVSLSLAAPLAGEVVLRAGIALGVDALRDPALYAHPLHDDDYWKLKYRWDGSTILDLRAFAFDRELGWTSRQRLPRRGRKKPLLLFGDSFAQGVPPTLPKLRLPRALGRLLPWHRVFSHAVSGYGLGQIYLRLRAVLPDFPGAQVVVAIMLYDIDRAVLTVRGAPKPYFTHSAGALTLHGVPVPADTDRWYRDHPPALGSYLLALLGRRYQRAQPERETEVALRRTEIETVTRALLEAIEAEARTYRAPLHVVLLYAPWDFTHQGWRERFLKAELARLGADVIDTKPALLAAAEGDLDRLYLPAPNHHPNDQGNRVIAETIAAHLKRHLAAGGR